MGFYVIDHNYSKQCYDNIELIKFTRDDVFDKLEEIETRLLADRESYRHIGRVDCYKYLEAVLPEFEKLWEIIRNSSIEEFYMLPFSRTKLDCGFETRLSYQVIDILHYI